MVTQFLKCLSPWDLMSCWDPSLVSQILFCFLYHRLLFWSLLSPWGIKLQYYFVLVGKVSRYISSENKNVVRQLKGSIQTWIRSHLWNTSFRSNRNWDTKSEGKVVLRSYLTNLEMIYAYSVLARSVLKVIYVGCFFELSIWRR